MAPTKNYFQFPIYLLDGDLPTVSNWIVAHTAHKIGAKIMEDGYDEWDVSEAIERGCEELECINHSEDLLNHFHEAEGKIAELSAKYGVAPFCRVREDIFASAMRRKPTLTENYFRVFAAMTAALGKDKFKQITRDRLHAGASGWKASEMPDGWTERVKFKSMPQVIKGLHSKGFMAKYADPKTRRDAWFSIRMIGSELEKAVAHCKAKRGRKSAEEKVMEQPQRAIEMPQEAVEVAAEVKDVLHPYVKKHAQKTFKALFVPLGLSDEHFSLFWNEIRDGKYGSNKTAVNSYMQEKYLDISREMKAKGFT